MLRCKRYNSNIKIYFLDNYNYSNLNKKLIDKLVEYFKEARIYSQKEKKSFKLVKEEDELQDKNKIRQVFKITFGEKNYFIKRLFKRKRVRYLCKVFLCKYFSGGIKSLKIYAELMKANISVPTPCFCLVFNRGKFSFDTILVTEEMKESISIYDYLSENKGEVDFKFKRQLIDKLAKFWANLLRENLLFKDASLDNFLLSLKNGDLKLSLVDVDNIYKNRFFKQKNEIKTLARFNAYVLQDISSLPMLTISLKDVVRFYKKLFCYYEPGCEFRKYLQLVTTATEKKLSERGEADLINHYEFL